MSFPRVILFLLRLLAAEDDIEEAYLSSKHIAMYVILRLLEDFCSRLLCDCSSFLHHMVLSIFLESCLFHFLSFQAASFIEPDTTQPRSTQVRGIEEKHSQWNGTLNYILQPMISSLCLGLIWKYEVQNQEKSNNKSRNYCCTNNPLLVSAHPPWYPSLFVVVDIM